MLTFAVFAAVVLLVVSAIFLYNVTRKSQTVVPGLKPKSKEHGNMPDIGEAGSLHQFLLQLHKKFGSIASFWMGQEQVVSIASPKLFKEHISVFDRPVSLFILFEPILTLKCIQYANGTDGRSRRNHYDKLFTHDAIQNYYEKFQKVTEEAIQKWTTFAHGDQIPLGEHMFTFALKSALLVLVGRRFEDEKILLKFKECYDYAWDDMEKRVSGEFPTPGSTREKEFEEAVIKIRALIKDCLDDAEKNPGKEFLILDGILAHTEDKDIITSDLLVFIIGGFHTTGNHLTWCFYYLAKHKEIQDKLYKEIKSVFEDGDMVTSRNVNKLPYLRQVIDETLRCAVVAPWAARYSESESQLGGYSIPAKTPVIHALGVCLQDETYWPEPQKFDPDRFSKDNLKKVPSLAYSPFGFAGKRVCPGYRFTYAELSVIIAGLINKFEVNLVDGQQDAKPVFGLVTHPAEEIWVKVKKRVA